MWSQFFTCWKSLSFQMSFSHGFHIQIACNTRRSIDPSDGRTKLLAAQRCLPPRCEMCLFELWFVWVSCVFFLWKFDQSGSWRWANGQVLVPEVPVQPKWMPMRWRLATTLMQDPADVRPKAELPPEGIKQTTGRVFKTLSIFTPTWGNHPIWLICLKWVGSTTN